MQNKDKIIEMLKDGMDGVGVAFVAVAEQQEVQGDMITLPASILTETFGQLGAAFSRILNEIDPDELQKYLGGEAEQRYRALEARLLSDDGAPSTVH